MHTWKCAGLGVEWAQSVDVTAVGTDAFFHDADAECLLLKVFKGLLDFEIGGLRSTLHDRCFDFIAKGSDFLLTLNFVSRVDGTFDTLTSDFVSDLEEIFLGDSHFVVTLRLADFGSKGFERVNDNGDVCLSKVKGFHKISFWKLVRSTFDHDNLSFVTYVNKIQVTVFTLFKCWVHDELTIDTTHTHCTERSSKWDVRDTECSRCAVHREDVSIVLAVSSKHQGNDLSIIKVAFREKRTQWTVSHTAGKNLLFGRTAFTLEVASRESARCSSALFVFNRQGEPCLT